MSLKRILGTMLATRMAGRGRRRGSSGLMSMLGGRRRRGGKMGLAALGYMAYRAYQDQQSRTAGSAGTAGAGGSSGAAHGSGSSGGLTGIVQDVVDRFSGGSQPGAQSGAATAGAGTTAAAGTTSPAREAEEDMHEEADAAERLSDQKALLLIRAMITAAYSDGAMSTEERQRIMGEIEEAGGDASDREVMEREIANPKPLDELLTEVNDTETAEEFYLASRAAVDGETEANRAYLAELRDRFGLSQEQIAEVEELAT